MIEIYKKRYQTCLEALDQLRVEQPELKDAVLSYNGILDPMAEGILPVLVGEEENKRRNEFTGSQKTYRVGVLVGISTDSSDLLGVVKDSVAIPSHDFSSLSEKIKKIFFNYENEFLQTVPMHSNRKVDGKRLWWWMLHGIEIAKERRPANTVKILDRAFLSEKKISLPALREEITCMSDQIGERFRLPLVLSSWERYFAQNMVNDYLLLEFELNVTSGFYVRTFVESMREKVALPLVVYSLVRTKVDYMVS